jgi:hypothetical protein
MFFSQKATVARGSIMDHRRLAGCVATALAHAGVT